MNYADGVLHLGGIPATDLVSRFGSPLYVYESAILDRQIDAVRSAFSSFRCTPAYAMKANSNITLLRRIAAAGFSFDAVSPGEVALLRLAGVAPERI